MNCGESTGVPVDLNITDVPKGMVTNVGTQHDVWVLRNTRHQVPTFGGVPIRIILVKHSPTVMRTGRRIISCWETGKFAVWEINRGPNAFAIRIVSISREMHIRKSVEICSFNTWHGNAIANMWIAHSVDILKPV